MLLFSDQRAVSYAAECDQGMRAAQPWVSSTMRNFQSLRDEFNFTNAATAEFYIEPFLIAFALFVDRFFGRAHIGQRFVNADVGPVNEIADDFHQSEEHTSELQSPYVIS